MLIPINGFHLKRKDTNPNEQKMVMDSNVRDQDKNIV